MSLFDNDVLDNLYEKNIPFTNSRDDFIKILLNCTVLNKIDGEISPEREKMFTYIMDTARLAKAEDVVLETVEQMENKGSLVFWELPKPFEKQIQMQKFNPDSCLPDLLRDYVKAVADNVQVDIEMCVLPLLSTLANCIHGKFRVCFPHGSHKEPLNLYTVTVASPGERKSGVFKIFSAPLFEYQKKENERRTPLIAEYRAKHRSLSNMFESATKGKNADEEKSREIALEIENLKPVHRLTLNITDCTPESLTAELADNNEVMGILDEECGIFNNIAGLYSNGVANLDIFLKSYDGSPYVVTRRTKENIYLDCPVITIGLLAQPDAFETAMNKPEFIGRGFIQRFLFSFPESKQGGRKPYSPPIPSKLSEQYNNLIARLLDIKMPNVDEAPHVLSFNKSASNLLDDYFYTIENRLKEGGDLVYIAEWANKLFAKCCRIAGILHLCTYNPTELIDENTAMKAINISMWAENQAHRAFGGTAFEDKTTKNAKRVLKKLKEKRQAVYTRNDITRAFQNMTKIQIDDVLELLDDVNCIRIAETKTAGRPKITIKVNPLLFDK